MLTEAGFNYTQFSAATTSHSTSPRELSRHGIRRICEAPEHLQPLRETFILQVTEVK